MSTSESPAPAGRTVPPSAGRGDVLGVRVAAALIDLAILVVLFVAVSALTGGASAQDGGATFLLATPAFVVYLVVVFLYFAGLEAALGRTVGKMLLGLRVVGWQGDRPSVVAVVLRTVLRVVDWLPLLYVVGFISMIVTGGRRKRLGDLAAETTVERTSPVRYRGLYATLLAAVLFGAVALSVVTSAGGLLSDATSSSACVFDRCNATANGDQVMELSSHVVAVDDISNAGGGSGASARATFTVAGHAVTLRTGETRAVGPSLVHLASVEDDVAKFSIDFSGLYLRRADVGEVSGVHMSTYTSYVEVTDDEGVVTVELPSEWDDVDGTEDPEYGPSIHVAPDLGEFRRTWNVPGIMVDVSTRHGADDSSTVLDQIAPSEQCTSEGREAYEDRRHSGEIERWTACDGGDTTVVVATLRPADSSYLLRVFGQAVDARDLVALDRALATVDISTAAAARADAAAPSEAAGPQAATANDADWIESVAALRTEIDDAIGYEDEELTGPVLTDMATAMRLCSRTLAAGPRDARVQRLRELVETACAEYDKGADCLATAAEIGNPAAGGAEDRRMTEALDCGFAGLNRGSELLVDAEIEAHDLQASQPG